MKRRQAVRAQEKALRALRLPVNEIYGAMIPSRLREEAALPMLAQSIARHGLLQPVVVQKNEQNGRYMLVCGARRLAACKMLGMSEIDAVQLSGEKPEAIACFLEEHYTRETAPFLKEAQLLRRIKDEDTCCLPEGEIRRRLAMLDLDDETQSAVLRYRLTLEQAESLLRIPVERRVEAAEIIGARKLTPDQAKRLLGGTEGERESGKRRAVRRATQEAGRLCDSLNAEGLHAAMSVFAQGQGLCIQISIRNEGFS